MKRFKFNTQEKLELLLNSLKTLVGVDDNLEPFKLTDQVPESLLMSISRKALIFASSKEDSYEALLNHNIPTNIMNVDELEGSYGSINTPTNCSPEMCAALHAGIAWTLEEIHEGKLRATESISLSLNDAYHCIRGLSFKKDGQYETYFRLTD